MNIFRQYPLWSYYLLLMGILFGLVFFPQPFYWIHGGPFDFPELMQATITASGVTLRTSALVPMLRAVWDEPVLVVMVFMSALPAVVALFAAGIGRGKDAVLGLLSRLKPWLGNVTPVEGVRIWLQAIAFVTAVYFCVFLLRWLLGGDIKEATQWNANLFSLAIVWLFIEVLFFNQGGLLEELGIRGYMQPLMNSYCRTPLMAAIAVGLLWAFFHVPRDILFNTITNLGPAGYAMFMSLFTAWCVAGSVIVAYFFNRLGGSALVAIAIHGLLNDSWQVSGQFSGHPGAEMLTRTAVVVFGAVLLVWWVGPQLGLARSNLDESISPATATS